MAKINDYINRQALLKHLIDVANHHLLSDIRTNRIVGAAFMNLSETVERIPAADVVEVVRCKNCRECDTTGYEDTPGFGWCKCLRRDVQGCFYCAHGEKGARE